MHSRHGSRWVRLGRPLRRSSRPPRPPAPYPNGTSSARQFWAFQHPRHQPPPSVVDDRWPRSPIDRFILSRLEAAGLRPATPADKRTLLRRATLDLLGIPPSSGDTEAFQHDESPEAFERVVDRLLASPQYGERWGRHWLDVARYADSNGMDDNIAYSDAWRYRDYVIAFLQLRQAVRPVPRRADCRGPARRDWSPRGEASCSWRPDSWRSAPRCWPRTIR